ncbi:MAG: substrate-binding domain-containing protein, partial [Cyanobacteria bacterium J06632_3]
KRKRKWMTVDKTMSDETVLQLAQKGSLSLFGSILLPLGGCATTASISQPNVSVDTAEAGAVINIGGSSETYESIERLTEAYQEKTGATFEFFPPSQSSGALEGVKSSVLDIGGRSRIPTDADLSDGVNYLSLKVTPLVMVVHESVEGVTDITAEQLKAVYKGEITNWTSLGGPDVDIVLFDVSEDESEKQLLRDAYLGADLEVTKAAVVFSEDDEMVEAMAVTDFSIAAVPFEDELDELPINIVSVDGVLPSEDTIESGAYPMALPLGIAISETPNAETQAFLDFVRSDDGRSLLDEDDD